MALNLEVRKIEKRINYSFSKVTRGNYEIIDFALGDKVVALVLYYKGFRLYLQCRYQ